MRNHVNQLSRLVLLSAAVLLAACGGVDPGTDGGLPDAGKPDSGVPDAGTTKTLSSIAVTPATSTFNVGATATLTATGTYSDSTTAAITDAAWSSSDATVATVNGSGVVTGVKAGTATITATKSGKSGTASVTINAVEVTSFPIFGDDFLNGEAFKPFDGANAAAWAMRVTRDTAEKHDGAASLKLQFVDGAPGWMGGAFQSAMPHDLSAFNALTFWAKASKATTVNVLGFGNNGTTSTLQVERPATAVTTTWTKYVIPVPNKALLTAVDGLFHFADDVDGGYTLWLDQVQFEKVDPTTLGTVTPVMATESKNLSVGSTATLAGRGVNYVGTTETIHVDVTGAYFTYLSSAPAIATVDAAGVVTAVAPGMAEITAKLGTINVAGKLTVTVAASTAPSAPPARPTQAAGTVISMLSNAYTNVAVDTWRTSWSNATLTDVTVGADNMKKYSALDFVGIETTGANLINATSMTHFHVDVWTADATTFRVKWVDFGANGTYQGGDDSEHELVFNATSTPALTTGQWVRLDIPMSSFTGLAARAHLAQLIFSALPTASNTVYVGNVYFHQ